MLESITKEDAEMLVRKGDADFYGVVRKKNFLLYNNSIYLLKGEHYITQREEYKKIKLRDSK